MTDDWPQRGPGVSVTPERIKMPEIRKRWHNAMRSISISVATNTSLNYGKFAKDIGLMRSRGVSDEQIVSAFDMFAVDVNEQHLAVDGKYAWTVFMANWHRYCSQDHLDSERVNKKHRW